MNYKIKEFIKFLGTKPGSHHIYVKMDFTKKNHWDHVCGIPAYSDKYPEKMDGKGQLYISVNLCEIMMKKPKISDVTHWVCEYIDLDCKRENPKIPATDEELNTLKPEIELINNWLDDHGFLPGYFDMTGNGYRWLLPVPITDLRKLPVKSVMKINEQKKEWLRILKRETGTNVDTTVGELSRITGIPGTMNVKVRDGRDRRREPFRVCDRVEDVMLRDYIMGLDVSEDKYIPETINYPTEPNHTLDILMNMDKSLETLIHNAQILPSGKRSDYDYAIAKRMIDWQVPMSDCIDILKSNGTTKARTRKDDYVKRTVMNAYMDVVIK